MRALDPAARKLLDELPPFLRGAPEAHALAVCASRESARMRAAAALARDRANLARTDAAGLAAWEALLRSATMGTLEPRRSAALTRLRTLVSDGTGRAWLADASRVLGGNWSFRTHDPAQPAGPADHVIRIMLDRRPDPGVYDELRRRLRDVTQDHLDLQLVYTGGFTLDVTPMDDDAEDGLP